MKKLKLVAILILFAGGFSAQTDYLRSHGLLTHALLNGRFWGMAPAGEKTDLLIGYREGVNFMSMMTTNNSDMPYQNYSKLAVRFYPFGKEDTEKAVDEFYADQDNLTIPVARVLQYLAAQYGGMDTAGLRKQVIEMRRDAALPNRPGQ